MKVENSSVIRRTARQYIFKNRGKSLIIILSVALCTFLFTTLFTTGGGILNKIKESMQRQIGGTMMGSYKYLNQKEYEALASDPKFKEVCHWIIVGEAGNRELAKTRTEIHWTSEKAAEKSFCAPEAGRFPQTEDEAVFSSLTLQALKFNLTPDNYDKLLGQKVNLIINTDKESFEKTFTICGVYTGDRVAMSQITLVSKAFQEKYTPVPTDSYYDLSDKKDTYKSYTGRINVDVDFPLPFNIEKQLIQALFRNNLSPDTQLGVSRANALSVMDPGTLLLVIFLLFTIFLSGYLIINNIFRINVYSDIRSHGLLKTIGMSGKQLSKLVKYQALYLSIPGILLGILGGSFVGVVLVPVVTSILEGLNLNENSPVQINFLIPLLSALFSLVTVLISCRRPARLASKVSPIEAVKYTELKKAGKKQKNKVRKNRPYSSLSFAQRNLSRDKKKVFWVVLSLSLSLVILNSIYTMLHSFSEDKFVEHQIATDFSVTDATLDNAGINYSNKNFSGVTKEFLKALSQKKGITELGNIYFENTYQRFTDEDFAKLEKNLFSQEIMKSIYNWEKTELVADEYRKYRADSVFAYGIDEFVLNNMHIIQGQLDMEKFLSGNYILVSGYNMGFEDKENTLPFFLPGEKITVGNNNGQTKEYEVMATVEMPYAFRFQQFTTLDISYYVPSDEFFSFFGEREPMRCLFNVEDEYEEEMENWMAAYTEGVEPMLAYTSRKVFKEEFKSFTNMIVIVGGLLTVILALIGLLNLTNTMITSILSRKLELAMLEAVGMTKKNQIQGMSLEGLLYAAFTILTGITLSSLFSVFIVRPMGSGMSYFDWSFTLLPLGIVFPIMIIITLLLPVLIYKKAMTSPVVERLRMSEL